MKMPFMQNRLWLAVCLFVVVILTLVLMRPLLPVDETRYLTVAWEMWQGGSKFVPSLNGEIYSQKPPMLFWLINIVWLITGVSEIAARLVGPAFGLASIILTARLARDLWPNQPGRAGFSALILATGAVFLLYGSTTMFDTMLTTAVLGAILALLALFRAPGVLPILGLGAALALGVLAKGPVVLVHVLPVAALMPVWADRATRPSLGRWYRDIGLGVAVALALVMIWLGPALVLGGEAYRTDVLWRQSAGRMVASFAHDQPLWFFPALLPVFFWPWGWSRSAVASMSARRLLNEESSRFVLVWAVSALVIFSLISGKQAHYLLPELPALALLLSGMVTSPVSFARKMVLMTPALLVSGLAIAIFSGVVPQAQVNGAEMPVVVLAMTLAVSVALIVSIMLVKSVVLATAIAAPATLVALHLALTSMVWAGYNPGIIAEILGRQQAKSIATTDDGYSGQFSFSARLERPVTYLSGPEALSAWIKENPGGVLISRGDPADPTLELIFQRNFHGKDYLLYRAPGSLP